MSGHGGRGGGGWSPHHFRPPSPYAPSPPPRLGSPSMNMFGNRLPFMPCPRPRWPTPMSPVPPGVSPPPIPPGPRPFRLPMHPPSPAPRGATPEYFRGVHPYSPTPDHFRNVQPYSPDFGPPSREFEYVGVPLEPPPLPQNYEPDEEESGPSTAEIIANQSQDYIDEKLAEYQATIYQLQDALKIGSNNRKMTEESGVGDVDVFKDAIMDENVSIQIDALRRLRVLASVLGVERTREELIPCLINCLESMHVELQYHLAEQLEEFVALVGGSDFASPILEILVKLSCVDEPLVRERAVKAMKSICNGFDNEQCEKMFYPLIAKLIADDWFTSKCSAALLFAICYPKMCGEKQIELRNLFRNLIQDDAPMVRRSAENGLIEFCQSLQPEAIKAEFIPIFDNLAVDEQDSVRVLAVDVGVAIAKKLKDFEVYEYLYKTFKTLSADVSWRVRQRIGLKIHEIFRVSGYEKSIRDILIMYKNCVRDVEAEVRATAATNLYNFTLSLSEALKNRDVFEKTFQESVMPQVHHMITDASDEVRLALSTNILSLSTILTDECFNSNILPLVIDALENEESMPFKENMLKNLNSLPMNVDITKSLKSINKVIKNLLENSQLHWRTRRNFLLAFLHIARNSTRDFFDQNLKIFYVQLLSDPVFAIRRTSPLILPLLIKQFGMNWAKDSLIPIFVILSKDHRYLFRYVALFAINELISPTLNKDRDPDEKYLTDLRKIIGDSTEPKKFIEVLANISKLNERLAQHLNAECFREILKESDDDYGACNDNIRLYAEDILDGLKENQKNDIYSLTQTELAGTCYLQGVLLVLNKEFIEVVGTLLKDPIANIQLQTKYTLKKIVKFCKQVQEEIEQPWVQETLKQLTDDDLTRIDKELDEEMQNPAPNLDDELIDTELIDNIVMDEEEALPDLGEIPELEVADGGNEDAKEDNSETK